jgi:hypothetical protein
MTMSWSPVLERSFVNSQLVALRLGDPVIDEYLAFAGSRLRLNSWLAVAFDLKVFFSVIRKEPAAVTTADVFAFIESQHDSDRRAYRHDHEPRQVTLGGRRVSVNKPRVRSVDKAEIELRTFRTFATRDVLNEAALGRMLAGLSTRRYSTGQQRRSRTGYRPARTPGSWRRRTGRAGPPAAGQPLRAERQALKDSARRLVKSQCEST